MLGLVEEPEAHQMAREGSMGTAGRVRDQAHGERGAHEPKRGGRAWEGGSADAVRDGAVDIEANGGDAQIHAGRIRA